MTKPAAPKQPTSPEAIVHRCAMIQATLDGLMNRLENFSRAVADIKEREATIRVLEERVADQAMQIARMEGYLTRVGDDDSERMGTEIVGPDEQLIAVRDRNAVHHFGSMGVSGAATDGERIVSQMAERRRSGRRFRWSEDR